MSHVLRLSKTQIDLFRVRPTSSVARGAVARGQGILTAHPVKSVTFSSLRHKKNWFLFLKISLYLINHETPHFAPPLQIVLQKFLFPTLVTQYLPQLSQIIMKKL